MRILKILHVCLRVVQKHQFQSHCFQKTMLKNKLSLNDKVYYWSYNSFIEGIRYNKQTNFKHSPIKSVSTFLGFWYN